MAYIGKVSITQEWADLESLIQAQVDGQSAFTFTTGTKYQLQPEKGLMGMCVASAEPDSLLAGEHLNQDQTAIYEPDGTNGIYVRSKEEDAVILLAVSELA